jgi:hypothetical protein
MENIQLNIFLDSFQLPGMQRIKISLIILPAFCIFFGACKKLVEVAPPHDSITTATAFADDESAQAEVNGIYSQLISGDQSSPSFGNGGITIFAGLSSDELSAFTSEIDVQQFKKVSLLSNNLYLSQLWQQAYTYLYQVNNCIEGLGNATGVSAAIKKQLTGECKFLRAFINFYLVNLFGDIPYVSTTNFQQTAILSRTPKDQIYQQIVADLSEAEGLLSEDYQTGEKNRANKWADIALLARVYLYQKDWANAGAKSDQVINSGVYTLTDLNSIFLANSGEAILQFQPTIVNPGFNAPYEANVFNIGPGILNPNYFLTDELINAFDTSDQRKSAWINSIDYNGQTYYYPFKYKDFGGNPGGNSSEYYMVLRLAEQYLIRAEANAQQNKTMEAITDLNIIRGRAGLVGLDNTLAQDQTLAAIEQERRIEFFAEWGHRWFDLKRTGRADAVLGIVKGSDWQSNDQLYPIPINEIRRDHNLVQNPGYQ